MKSKARLLIEAEDWEEDLGHAGKTMTVGALIKSLSQYEDDIPVYILDYIDLNGDWELMPKAVYIPITKIFLQKS